jgi:hypothetical protein
LWSSSLCSLLQPPATSSSMSQTFSVCVLVLVWETKFHIHSEQVLCNSRVENICVLNSRIKRYFSFVYILKYRLTDIRSSERGSWKVITFVRYHPLRFGVQRDKHDTRNFGHVSDILKFHLQIWVQMHLLECSADVPSSGKDTHSCMMRDWQVKIVQPMQEGFVHTLKESDRGRRMGFLYVIKINVIFSE